MERLIRVNKYYIYINLGLDRLGTRHSRPKPRRTARLGPLTHKHIYMSNSKRQYGSSSVMGHIREIELGFGNLSSNLRDSAEVHSQA